MDKEMAQDADDRVANGVPALTALAGFSPNVAPVLVSA
jgi:hypothetical protein